MTTPTEELMIGAIRLQSRSPIGSLWLQTQYPYASLLCLHGLRSAVAGNIEIVATGSVQSVILYA